MSTTYQWPLALHKLLPGLKKVFHTEVDPKHKIYDVMYILTKNKRTLIHIGFQPQANGFIQIEVLYITPHGITSIIRVKGFMVPLTVIKRIITKYKREKFPLSRKVAYEIYQELVKAKLIPPMEPNKLQTLLNKFKAIGLIKDREIDLIQMQKYNLFLAIVTNAILLVFLVISLYKMIVSVEAKIQESSAEEVYKRTIEELSKQLKMSDKQLEIYSTVKTLIHDLVDNPKLNGLIVCGAPGTGKTLFVTKTLLELEKTRGIKFHIAKGAVDDVFSLYALLYRHRHDILVLDDFDIKWSEEVIGLLKAATDTYPKRVITFPKETLEFKAGSNVQLREIPKKFVFTGKLIIITNKPKSSLPVPIRSRLPVVEIQFDVKDFLEILRRTLKNIAPTIPLAIKQEVFDYLVELYEKGKLTKLDFRTFELALTFRLLHKKDWKKLVEQTLT